MTSHSILCSFFFSTTAFHHVPFCGLKSTYTQGGRAGKLRGEGRVYWKRRAASLWERPEGEGHANQPTALFHPLRPSRGTAVHGCTPECTVCLFGMQTRTRVYMRRSTARPVLGSIFVFTSILRVQTVIGRHYAAVGFPWQRSSQHPIRV